MRIGVFIDLSNLYYQSVRTKGRAVDFTKYMSYIREIGDVTVAKAYGVNNSLSNMFTRYLQHVGIESILKDEKRYADGKVKCDVDVAIAVDILKFIEHFDLLVLGSADGDMIPVIKRVVELKPEYKPMVLAMNISREMQLYANVIELPESFLREPSSTQS